MAWLGGEGTHTNSDKELGIPLEVFWYRYMQGSKGEC